MPIFKYSAVGRDGATANGTRESEDEKNLAQTLRKEGLYLLEVKAQPADGFNFNLSPGEIYGRIFPIGLVEKMFFARNLAVMVDAGLSLTRALDALSEQSTHAKMKQVIKDASSAVAKGKSFAEALKTNEKVFGTLFINMVEVGEATGRLTLVLRILARQMKKDYDLRKRVKGAMMYPSIILAALAGVGTLMMIYVIPSLVATIRELEIDLPVTTKIIIRMSDAFAVFGFWMLAGLVGGGLLLWRLLRTETGKRMSHPLILKMPLFGALVKKFNLARFCRILSYLISAGVPIVRSLEITSSVLGNLLYHNAIGEASQEIQKGKQMHDILGRYPMLFPPMVIQMISVGEETGKISSMLLRIALFFEEDVNETTKNLSTIIEPILMVVIGVVVGFFAVAMFQPIYGSLGKI